MAVSVGSMVGEGWSGDGGEVVVGGMVGVQATSLREKKMGREREIF